MIRHPRRQPKGGNAPAVRTRRSGERGVLLVALIVALTVMMILLTASAQSWTAIMKREREQELIFRGNQYMHALRAYHKDHGGTFPTELKVLLEPGPRGHRYIRQLYTDPFSEEGEWNLLYLGPDGKSAVNPNARLLVHGVPGLPGGVPGLPRSSTRLADRRKGESSSRGRDRKRTSRFKSGNLSNPIVGVVSQASDRSFQEYMSKNYYDEWEFHVFLLEISVQKGRTGRIPGLNINPTGQMGRGGGIGFQGGRMPLGAGDDPPMPAPPRARGRKRGNDRQPVDD